MGHLLRERLAAGRTCIGLAACLVRTPEIVAVARACGFDFLLVDLEHSPIAIGDAAAIAAAGAVAGFPVLVRVGGPDHPDLARVLDCGAEGVVVPHVDTPEQARRVVDLCRFRPVGRRSLPSPLVRFGYATPPAAELMARAEAETLVVLMVESRPGVVNAPAMAALAGVDVLMIGANDLAQELGHTGDLLHPEIVAAFKAVAHASRRSSKVFGVIGLPEPILATHGSALGARLVVAVNDVNLLTEGGTSVRNNVAASWK